MTYYVKMSNPREFRRDILESSKKVIGCLQANRNVLEVRQRKRELLNQLQQQVKELALLVNKLDEILPDKQLREEAIQEARKQQQHRPAPPTVPKPEKPAVQEPLPHKVATEEDELSNALSSIEDKLKELN